MDIARESWAPKTAIAFLGGPSEAPNHGVTLTTERKKEIQRLPARIDRIVTVLKQAVRQWRVPIVGVIAKQTRDPFCVLISCLLSLRTKDATTDLASHRLFALARDPKGMAQLPISKIEQAIYPVGFYRIKARRIREISAILIERYNGVVPDTIETLLTLKGVGRKTANLVVTVGYGKLGICVDTHVHRISNRLGLVTTKRPEQTEMALRRILPKRYWIIWNDLLVALGQNDCAPLSPHCSRCVIAADCLRIGVPRSR